MSAKEIEIADPKGKLGVLLIGLGAVSTTFIAGVEAIKKGLGKAIGSLTQMGTVRLGKRTEKRIPRIADFVPLAGIDDLVFAAWDIFEEDAYTAANNSGVLEASLLEQVKGELEAIRPMKAVFHPRDVKRLHGTHLKEEKTKWDLAQKLVEDIQHFQKERDIDRMVMVWCGSTEVFIRETEIHQSLEKLEAGLKSNDENIPSSMVYAYAALHLGIPQVMMRAHRVSGRFQTQVVKQRAQSLKRPRLAVQNFMHLTLSTAHFSTLFSMTLSP